jgi:MFS family permease
LGSALLVVLAAGVAAGMLNPALPAIAQQMRYTDPDGLRWMVSGGVLAFAVFVVPAAVAGDLLGHVRVYQVGLGLFVGFSGEGALAQTPTALILARLGQGAAAALIVPQVVGYARRHLPPVERTVAYALFALAFVAGTAVGPWLGVEVLQGRGWHALFWILLLVTGSAAIGSIPMVTQPEPVRLDPLALAVGVLAMPAMFALVFPFVARARADWPGWYPVLLVLGVLLFAGCLAIEVHRRGVRAGLGVPLVALLALAGAGQLGALGLYLQASGGASARVVALALLTGVGGALLGAVLGLALAFWLDARIAAVLGIAVLAAAALIEITLVRGGSGDYRAGALVVDAVLVRLGLALTITTLIRVATPPPWTAPARSTAPALLFGALQLGAVVGGALLELLSSPRAGSVIQVLDVLRDDTRLVLVASVVVLAVAAVLALILVPRAPELVGTDDTYGHKINEVQ